MLQFDRMHNRLIALMLCLLLLPVWGAAPALASETPAGYVATVIGGVSVRQTPQGTAEVLFSLPEGTILPVLDIDSGWYYVFYETDFGFVAAEYTRVLTEQEVEEYLASLGGEAPVMTAAVYADDDWEEEEDLPEGDEWDQDGVWVDDDAELTEEEWAALVDAYAAEMDAREAAQTAQGEELPAAEETVFEEAVPEVLDAEVITEETEAYEEQDAYPLTGIQAEPEPELAYVSTPEGGSLTLRDDRSTNARALKYLPNGSELYVLDMDETWAQVRVEDVTGWVLSSCVVFAGLPEEENWAEPAAEEEPAETEEEAEDLTETAAYMVTVQANADVLEMKATPSNEGVTVARVPDGSLLIIFGQEGYFYSTVYGGMAGFVSMDSVSFDPSLSAPAPYVYVTSKTVNVREEPQRNATVIAHVNEGDVLTMWGSPYSYDGYTWYPVIAEDQAAYLRGDTCMLLSRNQYYRYQETGHLPSAEDLEDSGYLISTSRAVNVRAAAATTARALGKLEEGDVVPWEERTTVSGDEWYRIVYHDQPAYVMGQYVRVLTREEYSLWQQNSLIPEEQAEITEETAEAAETTAEAPVMNSASADMTGLSDTAYTLKDRVLIRKAASTEAPAVTRIPRSDTYVTLLGEAKSVNGIVWYSVEYGGFTGWIRSDMLHVYTEDEYDATFGEAVAAVQPAQIPDVVIPENDESSLIDMAFTLQDQVYLRRAPNVQSPSIGVVGAEHSYLSVLSDAMLDESGASYIWYEVQYNDLTGYIRGDLIQLMTENMYEATFGSSYQAESYVLEPVATPEPVYMDDVIDAQTEEPQTELTEPAVNLLEATDTAYTLEDNVFLRKSPTMQSPSLIRMTDSNTYIQILSEEVADSNGENYTWYQAQYGGQTGYVRSDLVHVMSNDEWNQTFAPPDVAPAQEDPVQNTALPVGGDEGLGDYTVYPTLRLGSTGDEVTELQQALFEQGYLIAEDVTGEYGTSTVAAVTTFQQDNNLTADGIAGQMTQSALFGTKSYDATLYPVEKSNWYTGTIQHVWTRGTVAVLTDVYTGLSWRARRLAGSYHADVEPLTAADTAVMCRIYGVSSAEEILSNKHWQRRPLWVTVGGRTYAASMYGVPHNYPDGDSIPDNAFSGQFCVHFVGSRVHRSGEVDSYHQQAIQYAYTHAPEKKK